MVHTNLSKTDMATLLFILRGTHQVIYMQKEGQGPPQSRRFSSTFGVRRVSFLSLKDFVLRYPKSYKKKSIYMVRSCDFVIRFENLVDGFRDCLGRLGIEPVRDLPQVNLDDRQGSFCHLL